MDPDSTVGSVLLYSILLGGGSVALAGFVDPVLRPFAIGSIMAVGAGIVVWEVASESGAKSGGIQIADAAASERYGDRTGLKPMGAAGLYYAAGVLAFGAVGLALTL